MSLPSRWIDALFSKLTLVYGQAFLRQWEGIPIEEVKNEWAEELTGFQQSPHSIRHGLENVNPDRPPNVLQFKALCIKAPVQAKPALPGPKADPARVAQAVAKVHQLQTQGPKSWAQRLQERESQGAKLSGAQRTMWREALGVA